MHTGLVFGILALITFITGTALLSKTKQERHFILFMISTRYLIGTIDFLARLMPQVWKFIADFSIVLFFSGVGAGYLSRKGDSRRNLNVILAFFGIFAIILWANEFALMILLFIILAGGLYSLSKAHDSFLDMITMTVFASTILVRVWPWYLALPTGLFGFLAFLVSSLITNAVSISTGDSQTPGVSPIIPWISETGQLGFIIPGVGVFIPLLYGSISLALLLILHESAHGILARAHNLKIKSTGILTFGIIPIGAFVEPFEEDFNRTQSIAKMRVLTMGSFANLITAIVTLFLFIQVTHSGHWEIVNSNTTRIANESIVYAIGNIDLTGSAFADTFNANMFSNKVYSLNANHTFGNKTTGNITLQKGTLNLSSEEVEGLWFKYRPEYASLRLAGHDFGTDIAGMLFWLFFFNFNVALVNLLPVVPFDGGKMAIEIMSAFELKEELIKNIVYLFVLCGLVILLINAYPLFQMIVNIILNNAF